VSPDPPYGVYVHIPFCRARCDYCAFATYTDRDHLMESYAAACLVELGRAGAEEGMPPASSVFFGGGTPSRLPADLLVEILDAVPRRPGAEVTVECNPEDADPSRLAAYRVGGVTRVSLGVQSTVPHVLAGLGRRHGSDQVVEAARAVAGAGFGSWSMDLIIGGAGETDADWERSLEDVLGLESPPPHLSAYSLTVEPGTPLASAPDRHPDDDTQAGRYEQADRILSRPATGGRRSPTGPDRGTSAGTTASIGPRGTTGGSARPPTPTDGDGGGGTYGHRPVRGRRRGRTTGALR
jgi:coproporphyrinogen III oxidase-like Fe-S oxidoreductase